LTVVDEDPEFDDMMANYRLLLSRIPLQTRCEFEIELENDSGRLEFRYNSSAKLLISHFLICRFF